MSNVAFAEKNSKALASKGPSRSMSAPGDLRIGAPDDQFEAEADRVADEVMAMGTAKKEWSLSRVSIDRPLQRKCSCGGSGGESGECEECKKKGQEKEKNALRRKATGPDHLADAPSIVNEVLRSEGQPLDAKTRMFFESRFGNDFSGVRLHTNSAAALSAHAVSARAYTVGHHIVFADGQHAPSTAPGRRLLAHELAHVIQQNGSAARFGSCGTEPFLENTAERVAEGAVAGKTVRVAGSSKLRVARVPTTPADFYVTGKKNDPGNNMNIYFDRNSSNVDAIEKAKIPKIISSVTPTVGLKLNGFRSEDEPVGLANDRAHKVDAELASAAPPHTGSRTITAMPASGLGQIEYRELRKVEVLPAPTAAPPPVSAVPSCAAGSAAPCGAAFTSAQPLARDMVNVAIHALQTPPMLANTTSLLTTLFGGVGVAATVAGKLTNLVAHLNAMPGQLRCHNQCDSACTDPAYNCGVGIGVPAADPCNTAGSKAMMTLCPSFLSEPDVKKRAQTLIHEGSHGTAGLQTDDISYGVERRIIALSQPEALKNTDSYVLLVRNLHTPGSVPIGPSPADKVTDVAGTGDCPVKDPSLSRALAHLEKWAVTARQDVSFVYGEVVKALSAVPPGTWAAGPGQHLMNKIAPLFGLTDPGAAAPFVKTVPDDKLKLAGIYDRYNTMMYQIYVNQVKVNKVAAGADSWTFGRPASITLTPAFSALGSTVAQVRRLFELLASATPGVSAALVPSYVEAADRIRRERSYGP